MAYLGIAVVSDSSQDPVQLQVGLRMLPLEAKEEREQATSEVYVCPHS